MIQFWPTQISWERKTQLFPELLKDLQACLNQG